MTTPYSPSQIQLVPSPPVQIWAGIPNGPPVLLSNQDTQSPVNVGYQNSIAVGGNNTAAIAPLTTLVMDGSRTIWGVAPVGTVPLTVIPGGSSLTASPVAEALAIIESGLATAIAEAIAGTGLPLIGTPTLLYQISAVPPASGSAFVGGTIPNQAMNTGCYDANLTQDQSDARFTGIVNRGISGTQHLTCTKKFWNVSDWSTTKNNVANYAAYGTRVIAAVQPLFYAGLPANSNFTTSPNLTAAQRAAASAEVSNLSGFITAMLGLGFTTTTLVMVLWQEPGVESKGMSPTDFANMLLTYGPTVNASGVPLVPDIDSGIGVTGAQSYANAALGVAGVTYAGLAQDLYLPTWLRGHVTLDTIGSIADAHGLPYGVYEFGCAPHNFTNQDCTNFLLGQHNTGGNFGILDYMQARLQAGKTNLDCMYYEGQCSASGAGDLSSPIGQDPTVTAPDFRIPLYQQIFDTLTAIPSTAYTIPATTTKTIGPINPSPVGGLAQVDYLSYEIAFGLSAGVGSTNPFAQIIAQWYDFDQVPKNQVPIDQMNWFVPMGTNADPNGPLVVYGSGRMRGGFMVLKINNQDSVPCTVTFLQVTGTSRIGKRDEWTWNVNANTSPNVPGFTLARAANASLQIGQRSAVALASGASASYLCGLFAGDVVVRIYQTGAAAAGTVNFTLQPQPVGVFGVQNLINENVGSTIPEQLFRIALPRAACLMTVKNNDANAVTVDFQITGVETS